MAGPITISVLGDTRDLVRGVGTVDRSLDGIGKKSTATGRVVKAGFLAMGAGALYAGKKLVDFTKAAAEDEAAQVKLAQTLRKTTGATDAQVAGVEEWITKQGQLLGVTDDELRPALQRMAEGTGDVAKAQDMVALAMDVSAGTGKSLKSVTEALLRAQNGSIGGLSRYGIATKDAEGKTLSLKRVTEGMAETFGGQATKAANTAAGQYDRLGLILSETGEAIGGKLLPYATDLADWALKDGIPAAEKWWKSTADTREEMIQTAGAIKDDALPVLKDLAGLVGDVAGFLADLPAPVRNFGAEAAAAALILPRLNTALGNVRTNVSGLGGNLRNAETRMGALKGAASTAAGVGGVLALSQAAGQTDEKMRILYQTVGGAATGFAIGGPIGALIGGTAGGLLGIAHAGHNAADGLEDSRLEALDFKEAINATTGALEKQGAEMILLSAQREGIAGLARRMGINERDLIGAVNGNAGATRRLNEAYSRHFDLLSGPEQGDWHEWLRKNTTALADQRRETTSNAATLVGWSKALKGLPPEVRTKVKAIGADISAKELRDLREEYDLTPKQVDTIIKAIGTEETVRKVRGVWKVLDATGKVVTDLAPFQRSLIDGLNNTRRKIDPTLAGLVTDLENGPRSARADLGPFGSDLGAGITRLTGQASSGGSRIGAALASGAAAGIANNAWQAVNAAGAMVADAVREANRRGDIHSPSRKTRKTGQHLAEGLERGLTDRQKKAREAARKLISGVLDQLDSGIGTMRGKLKALEDARDSYIKGVQDAARLPITEAGLLEDNTQTAAGIKDDLRERLDAVRNFQAKVETLIKRGLKGDALRQLLDAGVETGTVTAEALLAGGKAAVEDTVRLTNAIRNAAGEVGKIGGREFHNAGIRAQRDLVRGLERDRKRLDDAGRKMGVRLANAIRKELRRGLGDYDPVHLGKGGKGKQRPVLDRDIVTHARTPATVTVRLTAEQQTAIQRGKAIQLDLDAWRAAGGRQRR